MRNKVNALKIQNSRRLNGMRNKMSSIYFKVRGLMNNKSGDQMTGWLIVVLVVVVVGAMFLILYRDSITNVWNAIVNRITGLLNTPAAN